jgi:hypothetical protein
MRRFVVCCSIVGCLGSDVLLLLPALAQDPNPSCQIVASQAGQMFPNSFPTMRLESFGSDSYIRVECTGKIAGKMRLSLGSGSKLYNGSARFRLVSTSGMFAPTTSDYLDSSIVVPYANDAGRATGELRYQVQVVAPSGYLLPAASDYAVKLQAESIQ